MKTVEQAMHDYLAKAGLPSRATDWTWQWGFWAGWDAAMQEVQEEAAEREKAANRQETSSFSTSSEAATGFGIGTSELRQEEERQKNQAAADAVNRMGAIVGAPVLSMDPVSGDALQQIREELDIDGLAEAVQRLELRVEALRVGAEGRAKILRHQAERITKLEEAAGHHDALRDRVATLERYVGNEDGILDRLSGLQRRLEALEGSSRAEG